MIEYSIEQLINVEYLRQLMESHHQLSRMTYALLDANEQVIVSVGWQDICTRFHRTHPVCSERCRKSDSYIKAHLNGEDDGCLEYRCGNGMVDVAMPVMIEGSHVATIFTGQFFYEDDPPDKAFFAAQARECGFDPESYLAALERVPVFSREQVRANIMFLHSMVRMLADSGLRMLERNQLEKSLAANEHKQVEKERKANLRFFECMDRVNRAIQGANDLEQMMCNVLDEALSIFDCDRAYLMYPCDPEAESWEIPMERTTAGYSGAKALGIELSRDPEIAARHRLLLATYEPVNMSPGTPFMLSRTTPDRFGIKSMMAMAIAPKAGKPWEFGIHQCSGVRVWTPEEERLLKETGRRLEDALTSLLMLRDLRESEERYRRIVDTSAEGILMIGPDTLTTFVNQRMAEMLGYSIEEMLGRSAADIWPKEDVPDLMHRLEKRRLGISESYECRLCHRDSRTIWVHVSATPMFDANHQYSGSFAMFTDITGRKLAEMKIREANERFGSVLRAATAYAIICTDPEGIIKVFNEGAERMLGYRAEEVIDRETPELFHDRAEVAARADEMKINPGFEVFAAAARKGETETREWTYVRKDGARLAVSLTVTAMVSENGVLAGFVGIARDVTMEKKLEQQLVQSQKMECVGQLAGGVAHDFNNIMTAIVGFAHILGMKLGLDSPLATFIDKIFTCAERATSLTNDLLTFSRKQVMRLKPFDIGKTVLGSRNLISRLIREDIVLEITTPDEPLIVMAGDNHLTQILLNLTVNAKDAMSAGGQIAIAISPFAMDREYVARHGYGNLGRFALITFSDTGCGMDEKTRERIFEPFFTTKEVGKGTGLGLSTVYGVVRQLGGFINVYSEPGKGTIFRIYLPLAGSAGSTDETPSDEVSMPGGAETILLAEDDPGVREIAESLLSEAGYKVISTKDGSEALNVFSGHKDSIDILILDAVMPGKNGIEVFQQAERIRPGIKAIMMSGYTTEVVVVNGLMERGMTFLQKPVNPREFLRTIREVLDRQAISRQDVVLNQIP